MPTLLVSSGTSPAIVPEAFLLPDVRFDAVHILTTETTDVGFLMEWFEAHAPKVTLTISRVARFHDLCSEEDHFRFEEVLYRWMLEKTVDRSAPPHVCLSGGFKTMSAAVQKAASVIGASEVFHVLCNLPVEEQPKTAEEIASAREKGLLRWIRLGPESGWPQFRHDDSSEYPLETVDKDGTVRWVTAADMRFRDRLSEIVEHSHRIARAWDALPSLPFQTVATWSWADLEWLREPLSPKDDRKWVAALPKIELHCHLGGFATHGSPLYEVRSAAAQPDRLPLLRDPALPARWPLPNHAISLEEYRKLGDANGSALLRDPGCLRRQCEMLYNHLLEQNVIYAEIRCSPANYTSSGRSPWTVLCEIKAAFDKRMQSVETGRQYCQVNLLIIATRQQTGDYRAAISRHLSLALSAAEHWTDPSGCRVVGVDLAGYEDSSTRAHYFREEFTGVHRCGLALTVHAGENDVAEGIWRAVFDLNARRLGHALHLIDSPELMRSVADRGIGVEMCPYANYQIKGFHPMPPRANGGRRPDYPLKRYLEAGIRATVSTDNIGISGASLTDNLLFAAKLCPGLTRLDVLRLQRNAIEMAFLSPAARTEVLKRVEGMLPLAPKI